MKLATLISPFTTSSQLGVIIRYATTIVGGVLTVLGILGWLTPEQSEEITRAIPGVLTAIAAVITALVPLYAIITKSSSDKAAEVAKEVDKKIPVADTVRITTPGAAPDIVVSGTTPK